MRKLALVGCLVTVLFYVHPAIADQVSTFADVPIGMYVYSDNPPCGFSSTILDNAKDPATIGAVEVAFGPEAAAATLLVAKAASAVETCNGGDACKELRRLSGVKDYAACVTICLRTPPKASLTAVGLSDRTGKITFRQGLNSVGAFDTIVTVKQNDWSAWHDVVAGQDEDRRWVVCGTATNWSGDQPARKLMTLDYTP